MALRALEGEKRDSENATLSDGTKVREEGGGCRGVAWLGGLDFNARFNTSGGMGWRVLEDSREVEAACDIREGDCVVGLPC